MSKVLPVTINLINLAGLKKTMQSVFEQTFTDNRMLAKDFNFLEQAIKTKFE